MSDLKFETTFDPPSEVTDPISHGLYEYNTSKLGEAMVANYVKAAISVKDETGAVIGGALVEMYWEWMHIEILWVAPEQRGKDIGTRVLALAEDAARSRGFYHSQLETTSFQALDFYRKNGYEVFGTLEGKPAGHTWYYLKKDL